MGLPDDLKNGARGEDGFQLIPPEVAAALLLFGLAVCITLDKYGLLFGR